MKRPVTLLLVGLCAACSYKEKEIETGHKGMARIDPYLAGERLLERFGYAIESRPGWPELDAGLAMVVVPASVLSADGYVRELKQWVEDGGHAVILLENGESHHNDWATGMAAVRSAGELPDACEEWLEEGGIRVKEYDDKKDAQEVELDGESFEVFMEGWRRLRGVRGARRMLISRDFGDGVLTAVTDARPFRNRYIGDYDHAELLLALADLSPYEGSVAFVRNASLSFLSLLWNRGWPAVVALLLLVALWLWKSLPRFGPLDSVDRDSSMRAYDHHLEALGDFHWRLDRAEGLLRPLRAGLLERAQRLAFASGNREADLFQWIAERAGLTRERAERAMIHERPADAGTFIRIVADLQTIHLTIP